LIKSLAAAPPFDADDFKALNEEKLTDALFDGLMKHYQDKNERIRQQSVPVFRQIRQEQGEKVENVVVPMTDGFHSFQIVANMERSLSTEGRELVRELEKMVTLQVIDDEWKEHLRELDELKQSTYNAQYEQKDPLLIYKIESFELFGQMLSRINQRVLGLLFRCNIDSGDEVEEARISRRKENPKVKAGREELAGPPIAQGMTLAPAEAGRNLRPATARIN
jgi:preprotein translocase subunit SecA